MIASATENRMILADADDVAGLAFAVAKSAKSGGVLGLSLMPVTCFFVVEAYDCLRRRQAQGAHGFLEQHASRIRDVRARLKLLDADGFATAQTRFETIERTSVRIFNGGHRGLLGWLKRWMQDDVGFYFINTDLLCTTHVGLVNIGYDERQLANLDHGTILSLGSELHEFAQNIGQFIGHLIHQLGGRAHDTAKEIAFVPSAEDYKATKVYPLIAERLQTGGYRTAALFTTVHLANEPGELRASWPS